MDSNLEKAKKLINWVEVSRLYADNDTSISKNRCPKKYEVRVGRLVGAVESLISKESETVVDNGNE